VNLLRDICKHGVRILGLAFLAWEFLFGIQLQ